MGHPVPVSGRGHLPLCHPLHGHTLQPWSVIVTCQGQRRSCRSEQTEHPMKGHVQPVLEMKTHFPSCRFARACAAPGSGAGISAWHFVIPTNPAQMFHIDVMINSSRGKPQESVCLQEPVCQNTRLLQALPGCWAGWMEETLA